MFQTWFIFAFTASICSTLGMYMHQRLRSESAATAIWLKMLGVAVAAPMLLQSGLPLHPMFYVYTGAAAALWCINDIIYFRAVHTHGAALLSRLTPFAIIISFVAWFVIKPALFHAYMQDIPRFAAIGAVLLFATFCAFEVKRCPASVNAIKTIWPVLACSVLGTFMVKSAVDSAPKAEGVFGYVGIEGAIMLMLYCFYFTWRDPGVMKKVFGPRGVKTGMICGGLMLAGIVLRTYAQQRVDHPAYVSMISMLEVVWLIGLTRLSGWKDDSNKLAGLGIVLSALALAVLKIR